MVSPEASRLSVSPRDIVASSKSGVDHVSLADEWEPIRRGIGGVAASRVPTLYRIPLVRGANQFELRVAAIGRAANAARRDGLPCLRSDRSTMDAGWATTP